MHPTFTNYFVCTLMLMRSLVLHINMLDIWTNNRSLQTHGVSLNIDKCMFLYLSSVTLRYIMCKQGKLPTLRKSMIFHTWHHRLTKKSIQHLLGLAQFNMLGNNFKFVIDHDALTYILNQPIVSGIIAKEDYAIAEVWFWYWLWMLIMNIDEILIWR